MFAIDDIEAAEDAAQGAAGAMARQKRAVRDVQAIAHDVFDIGRRYAELDAFPVLVACDALIETLRPNIPEPNFDAYCPDWVQTRRECAVWADCAPPSQVTAMLIACAEALRGLELGLSPRKRLFVTLWNSLTPEDRKAFVDKIAKDRPND